MRSQAPSPFVHAGRELFLTSHIELPRGPSQAAESREVSVLGRRVDHQRAASRASVLQSAHTVLRGLRGLHLRLRSPRLAPLGSCAFHTQYQFPALAASTAKPSRPSRSDRTSVYD